MIIIIGLVILTFLAIIMCGKITGFFINVGTRSAVKSNNPKVQAALDKAKTMSNIELARAIRDESDIQVKEFLKEEFFARGNDKKDLYNY